MALAQIITSIFSHTKGVRHAGPPAMPAVGGGNAGAKRGNGIYASGRGGGVPRSGYRLHRAHEVAERSLATTDKVANPVPTPAPSGFASFGLTSVVLVLICSLVACRTDRRESFYPTFADADKDGAITHGWIPGYLPASSQAIHEVHDISPSTEWCAFEFLPSDSQSLQKNLKRVDVLAPWVRDVPSPRVPWWPGMLEGKLDTEKIHRAGFELYVVEVPETSVTTAIYLFVVDWPKGRAFFYSTRE